MGFLSFNDVNTVGTFTWIKCNDDAKSSIFREMFIRKHGGEFTRKDRFWEWNPSKHQMIMIDASQPKDETEEPVKTWIFKDSEDKEVKTQNILDFCKKYNLTRSSVYEVISGKRKHHKGFKFIEILN